MEHHFSIEESLRFGWHKTKAHSALLFQVTLTFFALQVVKEIVDRVLGYTALGVASSIVLVVIDIFLGAGLIVIVLKLTKGEHSSYSDIAPSWQLVWRFFCSSVLVSVPIILPILIGGALSMAVLLTYNPSLLSLLAISPDPGEVMNVALNGMRAHMPGLLVIVLLFLMSGATAVYMALRYSMARFAVIDNAAIVESLRISARMTHGVKWHLLLFLLVIIALNIVGAALFLVGLLVTVPVTVIAYAYVYQKLHGRHAAKHAH